MSPSRLTRRFGATVALSLAAPAVAVGTAGATPSRPAGGAVSNHQGTLPDGATWTIDVPERWNGDPLVTVQHEDAYLFLGDCHGTQGDGELCGVAVEMAATVTLQVDLIKGWNIAWPRLENERLIMAIGSTRPMEDAARIAYRELIRWLVADYSWDELEAYFFLTQAGKVRLGNMVDPKYTLGASVLKSYLG